MKTTKNSLRKIGPNEPIFTVPPYHIKKVFTPYAQSIDWGLQLLSIPNFWKYSKGKGIKVAVLDTGVDTRHRDLMPNVKAGADFTNSIAGYHDVHGHGTHCAGIIAAQDNSFGVVGVAPEVELYIGKVLNDFGRGSEQMVADGIDWAIAQEVDIISISLGAPESMPKVEKAVKKALKQNIIIICAAGNEGPYMDTVNYPAQYEDVIAIGAIDRNKKVTDFASRGNAVDLVAPGDNILSTYPPNGTAVLSGTSMAAPFATGVAALVLAKHREYDGATPLESSKEMQEHLRKVAFDLGPKGFDPAYGFGLINPDSIIISSDDNEPSA